MRRHRNSKARGVALISVMLVVAIVSSMAAQLLYRQHIDIERSARIMSREQAFLFVFGLETYARDLLARDNPKYDYYYPHWKHEEDEARIEEWSWPIPHSEMPDEWLEAFQRIAPDLQARVYDLSAFFNLNGVRQAIFRRKPGDSADEFRPNRWEEMYEDTFKGLLSASAGINDASRAEELWNTLLDWFDKDSRTSGGGAEDEEYLSLDPPYITGQMRMAWPDEIRLLKGFDGLVADRLMPLLSSLPHEGIVRMNINTIDDRLLRQVTGLDQPEVISEIRQRLVDEHYFRSRADIKSFFKSLDAAFSLEGSLSRTARFFDVKSRFFLFSACVRFGRDRPIEVQSVLHRRSSSFGKNTASSENAAQGTENAGGRSASRQTSTNAGGKDRVVVLQRRIGSGYYKEGRCSRMGTGRLALQSQQVSGGSLFR